MSTYEESRQFLQKASSDGVSLYDHLAKVLLKVGKCVGRTENRGSQRRSIVAGHRIHPRVEVLP